MKREINKKWFDNIQIGDSLTCLDGIEETVLDKTSSSLEVTSTKRTDKGISCKSWVSLDEAHLHFKLS